MVKMWRYSQESSGFKMDFRESLSILIKHDVIVRCVHFIRSTKKEQSVPSEKLEAGLSSVSHSCPLFNVSFWLLARERITITRIHCRRKPAHSSSCVMNTCHTLVIGNRCYRSIRHSLSDDIEVIKTTLPSDDPLLKTPTKQ